jgi:hypothetical protein
MVESHAKGVNEDVRLKERRITRYETPFTVENQNDQKEVFPRYSKPFEYLNAIPPSSVSIIPKSHSIVSSSYPLSFY